MRIQAMQAAIRLTSQEEVDFHNETVRDLNSRCGSFRYRSDALQSVTAEVESRRAAIEQAGRDWLLPFRTDTQEQKVLVEPNPVEAALPATAPVTPPVPAESVVASEEGVVELSEETARQPNDLAARYAASVIRQINGTIAYPKYALRRGEQGIVEIRLTFGATGNLKDSVVLRSSGYPALDEAASKAFVRGIDLPPPPEALIGGEFAITLPITFKLGGGTPQ
ncbi:MAG: energy transducer TonB [Burkholderiales bacterium]